MLHDSYTSLSLFIAYPSDVKIEVEAAKEITNKYNQKISGILGTHLNVTTWDDVKNDLRQKRGEAFQDFLNRAIISKCKIFVLVGGERYGTTNGGQTISNFEKEVRKALELRKTQDDFIFLPIFKVLKNSLDKGPQRMGIEKIRTYLIKNGVVFHSYSNLTEFVRLFTHELYTTLIERSLLTPKVLILKRFFSIFQHRDADPEADQMVVTYPVMDKKYMGESQHPDFWKTRLVPNIVFEDYKAILKIEKCLRLIHFRRFKVCTTANLEPHHVRMNRFWICLPRNTKAQEQLEKKYSSVSRFQILEEMPEKATDGRPEKKVKVYSWRNNLGEIVRVRSPLNMYLKLQRATVSQNVEWNGTLRDIVAKDFAVLARFTDRSKGHPPAEDLKDFFLGGLRGLGTWGAAWFLDKRYHILDQLLDQSEGSENFQVLLEITYLDGCIVEAVDVSDKPQNYFDVENSQEGVSKVIASYKNNH